MAKNCISISKCLKLFRECYKIIFLTNIDLIFSVVAQDAAGKKMKTEPQLEHRAVLPHFMWAGRPIKTRQDPVFSVSSMKVISGDPDPLLLNHPLHSLNYQKILFDCKYGYIQETGIQFRVISSLVNIIPTCSFHSVAVIDVYLKCPLRHAGAGRIT